MVLQHLVADSERFGMAAGVGQCGLCALLHDIAQLSGKNEAVLALHRRALDPHDVARQDVQVAGLRRALDVLLKRDVSGVDRECKWR